MGASPIVVRIARLMSYEDIYQYTWVGLGLYHPPDTEFLIDPAPAS